VLTTSAFGEYAVGEHAVDDSSSTQVLRAWEPLGLYRRLFNRKVRAGGAASFVRTEPGALGGLLRTLRRFALIPDGQLTWLPAALRCALSSLRDRPAHLLYSTSPPASAHLLGLWLKRRTNLPWVADFRDAWTYDPLDPALEEMPYRLALERRLEEAVVEAADVSIAATDISAEYLRRTYPAAADKIHVITNGFDPDDFGDIDTSARPLAGEPLTLVHTGSFSASHPQRTPLPLFAALTELLRLDPTWAGRLRLVLVGHLSPEERDAATPLVDRGIVELAGPQERPQALAFQTRAHILLLVDHPRPWPASNVPGKFYEYLAMQRPILALTGPGMVARLIEQLQVGYCAPPDDSQAICSSLQDLYARFVAGRLHARIDDASIHPFHRRQLTGQLAHCFDHLLDTRRRSDR
jgi:glycosyltransferase involved in cell wall biosynthesis